MYVKQTKHDVILLQETKWRFESSWEDDTHYYIHSGTSVRDHQQAGLLTILSKRIVDRGSLRFVAAIDGRLLRVQFKHGPRQVDVINFYQHTWRNTAHVQAMRYKAWRPSRNRLRLSHSVADCWSAETSILRVSRQHRTQVQGSFRSRITELRTWTISQPSFRVSIWWFSIPFNSLCRRTLFSGISRNPRLTFGSHAAFMREGGPSRHFLSRTFT